MIKIIDKSECAGCRACWAKCPTHCISMQQDEEGFLYPVVDEDNCVKCGMCDKICPNNEQDENNKIDKIRSFAVVNSDEKVLEESSSGGAFSLLADYVIENNGVVFGASMTNDCKAVHHIFINKKDELPLLRGSKYAQSDLGDSYKKVEIFLAEGKKVLFSGTPCQVNGLKKYLGREYKNLYCVDFICHGVPSSLVLQKYLEFIENKLKSKITKVVFRDKNRGGCS